MQQKNQEIIIALCAGEASGDLLGAHLMDALRRRYPYSRFVGIGGPRMQAAGLISIAEHEPLAVRGYLEVVGSLWEIYKIRRNLISELKQFNPHVFIGIDSPDFNLPVAAKLKAWGIPTIHYVSPSVWAWRPQRIHKIIKQVNRVLCLFPMEPELYRQAGGNAEFVGHPLAQLLPLENSKVLTRERLKLDITAPVFTLMPGSRVSEIEYMAPVFFRAAELIRRELPQSVFLLPYPSAPVREALRKLLERDEFKHLNIRMQAAKSELACVAADVVLVASGTAALEAALCKRPMVISYKISALSYMLVRRKINVPHIGLPNILLGSEVVPELIQKDATPEKLATAVLDWYYHPVRAAELEKVFAKLHRALLRNTDELAAHAVLSEAGVLLPRPEAVSPPEPAATLVPPKPAHEEPRTAAPAAAPPAPQTTVAETHTAEPNIAANPATASPEATPQTAPAHSAPPAPDAPTQPEPKKKSLLARLFGSRDNDDEAEPLPQTNAAPQPDTPATPAPESEREQPSRRVLESDEVQSTSGQLVLPKSSVLNTDKPNIFTKYRQQPETAPDETAAEAPQAAPEHTEPHTPAPSAAATPDPTPEPAAPRHDLTGYLNRISMASLPSDMNARIQAKKQAEAEAKARAEAEEQARLQAEAEEQARLAAEAAVAQQTHAATAHGSSLTGYLNRISMASLPSDMNARIQAKKQAEAEAKARAEAEEQARLQAQAEAEEQARLAAAAETQAHDEAQAQQAPPPKRVSQYSSNPKRYFGSGGKNGMFY